MEICSKSLCSLTNFENIPVNPPKFGERYSFDCFKLGITVRRFYREPTTIIDEASAFNRLIGRYGVWRSSFIDKAAASRRICSEENPRKFPRSRRPIFPVSAQLSSGTVRFVGGRGNSGKVSCTMGGTTGKRI